MSRPSVAPRPALVSAALRRSLSDLLKPADLLKPGAAGLDTLSELAARLLTLVNEGVASRVEAHTLLLEAASAVLPALVRVVRRRAEGIREELAEEVVAEVVARLGALFDHWRGTGPFHAYLTRTLEREAWAVLERETRSRGRELPDGGEEPAAEAELTPLSPRHAQALRRFAWYLYGSPDNPERVRSDKALIDFLALSARLERRPFAELVRDLQPRPGAWHQGRGEEDCKWWRGRAQVAQRRVMEALKQPRYRAVYEGILAELGDEDQPARRAG